MKRLIPLALLLWSGLALAEIIDPDGEDNPTDVQDNGGTACNSADCTTHVKDDDTATAVCDNTGTSGGVTIKYTMGPASANPTTGANEQTVQGTASQHDDANNGSNCDHVGGGSNPSIGVEIYCNGTASTVFPVAALTAITGDAFSWSGTFQFGTTIGAATCAADGSDLEFQVTLTRSGGSPANRRWGAIEELEWDASVTAGGRRLMVFE